MQVISLLRRIARYLAAHPAGVIPDELTFRPAHLVGTADDWTTHPDFWSHLEEIKRCSKFVELTGETGDVVLMHPLMLHSATSNARRHVRVITNPPVHFREPQRFDRPDGAYSLVERKTIESLGGEAALRGWKPTMPPEAVVPARVRRQEEMKRQEALRLAGSKSNAAVA